jgi:hypothetical protein
MCGKIPTMLSHLIRCDSVSIEVKKKAEDEKAAKKNTTGSSNTGQTPTMDLPNGSSGPTPLTSNSVSAVELPIKCHRIDGVQQNLSVVATKRRTPGRQHDFSRDLCDLFVSCGIAWNSASNPQLTLFCKKWIPGAEIPDQRALAGCILKE